MITSDIELRGDYRPIEDHANWMPLARYAYQCIVDGFEYLQPGDWDRQTPCVGWTVRDLGGHVLGAMRSAASLRETALLEWNVARRARRTGEVDVDARTAIHIESAAGLGTSQVVAAMRGLIDPAVKGRSRIPAIIRRAVSFRVRFDGFDERWTLDYLQGCILTRDTWIHRLDLLDAVGTMPDLDECDRAVVGDIACEWVQRHGQPVRLTLTGPAGGCLVAGDQGDEITLDALEFCRIVSGRGTGLHPLLAQQVPF